MTVMLRRIRAAIIGRWAIQFNSIICNRFMITITKSSTLNLGTAINWAKLSGAKQDDIELMRAKMREACDEEQAAKLISTHKEKNSHGNGSLILSWIWSFLIIRGTAHGQSVATRSMLVKGVPDWYIPHCAKDKMLYLSTANELELVIQLRPHRSEPPGTMKN
jgi:hypothetical protein